MRRRTWTGLGFNSRLQPANPDLHVRAITQPASSVSRPLSPVLCLLSSVLCSLFSVFCFLSSVSCLLSPVFVYRSLIIHGSPQTLKFSLAQSAIFDRLSTRERYRRGRNGLDSKSSYGPKDCTWVRIPPSPPHLLARSAGVPPALFTASGVSRCSTSILIILISSRPAPL